MIGKVAAAWFAVLSGCAPVRAYERPSPHGLTVELTDAGQEPRQLLRLRPVAGMRERIAIKSKSRIERVFVTALKPSRQQTHDFPTVLLVGNLEVTSVAANGEASVRFVVTHAEVLADAKDAGYGAAMTRTAAKLYGARVSGRISSSGQFSAFVYESGAPIRELSELRDSLQHCSVAFPDAEIGVGATWVVASQQSFGDITWTRRATYRLFDLADGVATIEASIALHAGGQVVFLDPQATTRLVAASGTATGMVSLDLARLSTTGTLRGTSELNLELQSGRRRGSETMKTDVTVTVVRLADGPTLRPEK